MDNERGLTAAQAEASRARHGENRLTPPARESLWRAFGRKLADPLIIVLAVVMLVSAGVAVFEYVTMPGVGAEVFLEPLGVLVALLLATGVGFAFEVRASREFDVLNRVSDDAPVRVVRDGRVTQVPRWQVVVGDLVEVETGDEVPADGDLVEAVALSVNESSLTGEPSAHKYIVRNKDASVPAPAAEADGAAYPRDRLMRGTTVIEGRGRLRVTAVGDATEYGRVARATQIDSGVTTPLDRQLAHLGRALSRVAFAVAAAIIVGRLFYFLFLDGEPQTWLETLHYALGSLMIAVTLIAVAVPEGLPLSITLSLALSMRRLLKENNLVRRLHACETMGAATVICTDKTGTLTQNRMAVRELVDYAGDAAQMAEALALNSTAWLDGGRAVGNSTEGALLLWLAGRGVDYAALRRAVPAVAQVPFSTERKRMETTVDSPHAGRRVTYIKGAPELLLADCDAVAGGRSRDEVLACLRAWQAEAMRTLGFAVRTEADGASGGGGATTTTFFGLCAIADPVRPEVPEAIATCRSAGIRVVMVTGDTQGTAVEVGRECGILAADEAEAPGAVMTGEAFAAADDAQLEADVLPRLRVLSRARPLDKQRLVRLLQRRGEVVAVTGDGTNDAPALHTAQVGLSMGDGTAVAKEASDISILDNSFSSIVKAVLWGRSLYKNIGRFILFQMTVNVAACTVVLVGAFLGKESPLSVTQMLWVNLIMDTFAAMALSALPPDPAVMQDRPRSPRAHIIDRRMARTVAGWGTLFSVVLLLCWFSSDEEFPWRGWFCVPRAWFFTIFVMLQFWNLFNARLYGTGRTLTGSLWRALRSGAPRRELGRLWSPAFVAIAALIVVGQWAIVTFGGAMFSVGRPLGASEWLRIVAGTSLVLVLGEVLRAVCRR